MESNSVILPQVDPIASPLGKNAGSMPGGRHNTPDRLAFALVRLLRATTGPKLEPSPRGQTMLQVYNALFETALRLGREYGPPVAVAVLVFVGCGVALRVLARVLSRGGPREN
jgi:hypothetical protein